MANLRTILVALAPLLLCMACSGGSSDDAASKSKSTPTVATVSAQTTCDLLFVDDQPRLWSQAVDLVAGVSNGRAPNAVDMASVSDQLEDAAESSGADLRPHIEQMAKSVRLGSGVDFSDFKTAAREVANACTPYEAGQ